MKTEEVKRKNIRNVLFGIFFTSFSAVIASMFLPYFLKEQGLSALEIGGLFTLSIAVGSLFFSLIFSKILRKLKLRTGLFFAGILSFLKMFSLYLFPSSGGVIGNKAIGEIYNPVSRISIDSTIQHNLVKGKERKTSVLWGLFDGFGLIFGICVALILIPKIGFRNAFLVFSFISLPALFLYIRVKEDTRFKAKKNFKFPKTSNILKLLLFSEVIYWFALSSSFALVITFLVSDKLSGTFIDLGILFIALYGSMNLTLYFTKEKLDKFKEINTAISRMFLLLVSAILIILFKNFWIIFGAFVLEGIGAGIWVPSKTALQWKNTKKENREKVSGWLSGTRGFVQALGPLAGGFLITSININAAFYLKATISLICLGIYFYVWRKN